MSKIVDIFRPLITEASKGVAKFPEHFADPKYGHSGIFTGLEAAARTDEIFLLSTNGHIEVHRGRTKISIDFDQDKGISTRPRPYLLHRARLNDAGLRLLFTRLEFLVFACIKWERYEHDVKYRPETESFSERLKLLKGNGVISREDEDSLRLAKATRDEFAHSTLDINDLYFNGLPLKNSFPDLLERSKKAASGLEDKFLTVQSKQVDWRIFNLVIRGFAKPE